jgi:FMN phosphatase YigB (HAD superfamily)
MKPQPEYFEVITKHVDAAPHRIIFIDDQQNYLDAAAACGWRTILFNDANEARVKLENLLQTAGHQNNLINPK